MKYKPSNGKTILIVDDEEGIRLALQNILAREGFTVEIAATGLHALQKVKTMSQIDLVVSDLKMPGLNGIEFFQQLKVLRKGTQFIMITGFIDKNVAMGLINQGVGHLILKPFNFGDLLEKIRAVLKLNDSAEDPEKKSA